MAKEAAAKSERPSRTAAGIARVAGLAGLSVLAIAAIYDWLSSALGDDTLAILIITLLLATCLSLIRPERR